jgi:hypothetical protein
MSGPVTADEVMEFARHLRANGIGLLEMDEAGRVRKVIIFAQGPLPEVPGAPKPMGAEFAKAIDTEKDAQRRALEAKARDDEVSFAATEGYYPSEEEQALERAYAGGHYR